MTTPHRPELGDSRRTSSTRPLRRSNRRRSNALRWFRPAHQESSDRGAGFVEIGVVTVFAAAIITLIYQSELSSTFNNGVRQMVCLVGGPECGDETWVDHDRPEEPEEYEWGGGDNNHADNQNIAMQSATAYGWTDQEWTCLDSMWGQMSGWDPSIVDPQYGTHGIVGFNPAVHGAMPDGFQNSASVQIDWGLSYIESTHGTPCQAWSYWQSTKSY